MYEIEFTPQALEDLKALKKFDLLFFEAKRENYEDNYCSRKRKNIKCRAKKSAAQSLDFAVC